MLCWKGGEGQREGSGSTGQTCQVTPQWLLFPSQISLSPSIRRHSLLVTNPNPQTHPTPPTGRQAGPKPPRPTAMPEEERAPRATPQSKWQL